MRLLAWAWWFATIIERSRPCREYADEPCVPCQRHRGHRGKHRFRMTWEDWDDG